MTEYVITKVEKCSQCGGAGEIEFLGNHHAICPKCAGAGEFRKSITVEELLKEIGNGKTLS